MKTSARPVSDWLSLLKDLTEGTRRSGGIKRNLAVQSIPHHSSLFTCLPVSTPGSLSNLSCPPSRRPSLFPPTQSEDTLPLSFSHFKLSSKLTFYRQRGTSKVFDELEWINSLLQIKKKKQQPCHVLSPRSGVISNDILVRQPLQISDGKRMVAVYFFTEPRSFRKEPDEQKKPNNSKTAVFKNPPSGFLGGRREEMIKGGKD